MPQELIAKLEQLKRENPNRFFEKIASIPSRWKLWKSIIRGENVNCQDVKHLIALLEDDFLVSFE